jgi:hypothetical protein
VTAADWRLLGVCAVAVGCLLSDPFLLLPLAAAVLIATEVSR